MGGGQSKPASAANAANPAAAIDANVNGNDMKKSVNVEQTESVSSNRIDGNKDDSESKCPMHNSDGTYSYSWRSIFQAAKVHGVDARKPLTKEQLDIAVPSDGSSRNAPSAAAAAAAAPEGCPVKHQPASTDGCPVKHGGSMQDLQKHPMYNVYSQPIDKSNNMPTSNVNQLPASTQKSELSTHRVSSNIPKGGGGGNSEDSSASTWTYPSPQMFYNALVRKGKAGDTGEEDIATVVALHNNMNEKTWRQVVEWERQICGPNSNPKLLKFTGRPHDLSPKGYLKHHLLGHPLPYDRHDWTIVRTDGTTMRYVIDYYYDETLASEDEASAMPKLQDHNATPSLLIDVRPALDSPQALWHRAVTMPSAHMQGQTTFDYLPMQASKTLKTQVDESIQVWQSIQGSRKQQQQQQQQEREEDIPEISDAEAIKIATSFAKALSQCQQLQTRVDNCTTEEECSRASVDLTICMGNELCPVQHTALIQSLQSDDDDDVKIDAALERLTECVMTQTVQRHHASMQHPERFEA